jgi:hypothetical protein
MKKGYIVDEVCAELEICRETFYTWTREHPEFLDAYKKGRAAFSAFWTRAYKKIMMGLPLSQPKKTKTPAKAKSKKGKEKPEEKPDIGKANPAMMIFYMKAHCGWRETVINRVNGKVSLLTPEMQKKLEDVFGDSDSEKKPKPKTKRS